MTVNYNLLYTEMLAQNFPEKGKTQAAQRFLKTDKKAIEIINFNQFISDENQTVNKRHISYDEPSILEILTYQDDNKLNSTQVAKLFNISRITLRKWKKHFNNINN
jgi:DNA-binding transcriptional regulator YiaG